MQSPIRLLVIPLLLLATVARAEDDKLVPSISVVGQGEVQVPPDMATVTLGVATEAPTAAEALKANNERMAELLKTLRAHDIADKHIQTSNFNVSPKQSVTPPNRREPPKIVGYFVTNQVHVKVMELGRLGAILDAVVTAGGNTIQGVNFSIDEPAKHLDQARRKALADARHKAELYASEAGVKLGAPLVISEQSGSPSPRYALGARLAVAGEGVPIATGEQTLTANIHVTYAITE